MSSTASTSPNGRSPEEIEKELAHTRHEMSDHIHELQERLEPKQLINDAFEYVESHVDQQKIYKFVVENPIPVALTGAGIGWLATAIIKGPAPKRLPAPPQYQQFQAPEPHATTRRYRASGKNEELIMEKTDPKATVGATTGYTAPELPDDASKAEQLKHKANEYMHSAQSTYHEKKVRAQVKFDEVVQQQPLAISFIGLGIGLAIGLMIPSTQREDQLLGPHRDRLRDQALAAGREQVEKAREQAHRGAEQLQERINRI